MNENMKKLLYVLIGILSIGIIVLILLKTGKPEVKTYTVKFDTDGGTEIVSQTVEAGSVALRPSDPTKEGYTFDSWLYENATYNFNASVNKDITLVAKWNEAVDENAIKVTFDTDGGSTIEDMEPVEGIIIKPSDPTKAGYVFKYWDLNGVEFDFSTMITESITLKAIWEEDKAIAEGNFKVVFDSNGGSSVEAKEVKGGSKVARPTNPTRPGYVFLDWYLDGKIYNFSSKVTANITLIAEWAKEGKYTITFDSDGGSNVASQTVNAGKTVSKPTNPTKTDMMFKEWQLNGKTYDFNTKVKENMTLKAVWKTPEYTVKFDTDGGNTIKSQVVQINKTAKKPANPTKTGSTFAGWYVGETEYTFTEKVTADITIKAKWNVNKYTITFDSDGGTAVTSQSIEHGGVVTRPASPTKAGATFVAWQLNGADYNFNTKVTGPITLKAKWGAEATKTYTFKLKEIDELGSSPEVELSIYENGTKVAYTKLMYMDGGNIPFSPTRYTVSKNDIKSETTIKAIVSGKTVTVTKSN